jgi:hypothetical protein
MQQTQRILCAVMNVCVPANACHRKEVQLWSSNRERQRKGVIKPRVTIDDDRKRFRHTPAWCGSSGEGRVMKGWPSNERVLLAH